MIDKWDTDDIPAVYGFFIRNRQKLKDGDFKEGLLIQALEKLRYISRANTLTGIRSPNWDLTACFSENGPTIWEAAKRDSVIGCWGIYSWC